ncbi:MAG: trehalose-phosphatase [Actinomycetes bacterium]
MSADASVGPEGRAGLEDTLARFASRGHVLAALDFDGVLAPIVTDRDAARPLPEASRAVRRLVEAPGTSVALVSGRTLADLVRLASPPDGVLLVASHGAELGGVPLVLDDARQARLDAVLADLAAIVAAHPGTDLETKPAGGVLHTRQAERPVAAAAAEAVLCGPATRPGVHVMRGKEVVELSVLDADKGTALRTVADRLAVDAVLYIGDDVTDENAFAVLGPDDVTVKVGRGETLARWRVPDPAAVAVVLHELADLRGGGS